MVGAMPRRVTNNPKRRIASDIDRTALLGLAARVSYSGSPAHKKNPGDFHLSPPSQARLDKTLCDEIGIASHRDALRLLRVGVERGLISVQRRGDFPQNIWSVTGDGHPLEAQLENRVQGTYHGYPMPLTDDFRDEVLDRWNSA